MAKIRWTQKALEELDSLLEPIASEDTQTAVRLSRHIDSAVSRLAVFPKSGPIYLESVRRLDVPRLPYVCFYEYVGDVVWIIRIRHDRQKPL